MPKPYNGHRSWNAWNVALWIGNDEGIYRFALECKRKYPTNKRMAVAMFMRDMGYTRTPDGGKYTKLAVKEALEGLE